MSQSLLQLLPGSTKKNTELQKQIEREKNLEPEANPKKVL